MKKILLIASLILLAGCVQNVTKDQVTEPNVVNNNTAVSTTKTNAKLDLSGQGLTKVSQDVFKNTNLQELDVPIISLQVLYQLRSDSLRT